MACHPTDLSVTGLLLLNNGDGGNQNIFLRPLTGICVDLFNTANQCACVCVTQIVRLLTKLQSVVQLKN